MFVTNLWKGMFTQKTEILIVNIYSLSCRSKPVSLTFFCATQKKHIVARGCRAPKRQKKKEINTQSQCDSDFIF